MTFDLAAGPRIYNLKQVANKPDERPFESHGPQYLAFWRAPEYLTDVSVSPVCVHHTYVRQAQMLEKRSMPKQLGLWSFM